jgi:hypothetical protein
MIRVVQEKWAYFMRKYNVRLDWEEEEIKDDGNQKFHKIE